VRKELAGGPPDLAEHMIRRTRLLGQQLLMFMSCLEDETVGDGLEALLEALKYSVEEDEMISRVRNPIS